MQECILEVKLLHCAIADASNYVEEEERDLLCTESSTDLSCEDDVRDGQSRRAGVDHARENLSWLLENESSIILQRYSCDHPDRQHLVEDLCAVRHETKTSLFAIHACLNSINATAFSRPF
jgi:hypothetical protein